MNQRMRAPFASTAVGDWFVERVADDPEQDLSNLKLQKLVYLAHSLHLYRHHLPLVEEPFQAWKDGPALKQLYGVYKEHGNRPIRRARTLVSKRVWPTDAEHTLNDIWVCFGGYSASKLRAITHEAGPWRLHWSPDARNVVIPQEEIRLAWTSFEKYAETPVVARASNATAALAKYSGLLKQLPTGTRGGGLDQLLEESNDTEPLRRRATGLRA